jgi:3-(3-hydroxy-phenyl)propionate hydroxylase
MSSLYIPQRLDLPDTIDVLIVGYGPVGATLANLLGRYGVAALAIDQNPQIFPQPRAIALDHEALRILQMAGLSDAAFGKVPIPQVRLCSPMVGEFCRINMTGQVDGHSKLVTFYQPELEQALRDAVKSYPQIQTAAPVQLKRLHDDGEQVTVELLLAQGRLHRLRCRYVVAADGASSTVRGLLGLDFMGKTYAQDWLIVDARRTRQPIEDIEFVCDPERPVPHMVAPDGRERWEFMLKPHESREQVLQPQFIQSLLKPWADPEGVEIERTAVYRFHARVADQFGKGRVFLVGDAAHITPPFVGQGLCAGLRDVANLAWKLAWVLRGQAHPQLLKSYDQERRPHAKAMIQLAKTMGLLIKPSHPVLGVMSAQLLQHARRFAPVRDWFDDLKIKPKNRFAQGVFVQTRGNSLLIHGATMPQVLLHDAQGVAVWSDDAYGDAWVCVGVGVDPTQSLLAAERAAWEGAGGRWLQIQPDGLIGLDSTVACYRMAPDQPNVLPSHRVVVVRPDRVVAHDGAPTQTAALLRTCLALFQ